MEKTKSKFTIFNIFNIIPLIIIKKQEKISQMKEEIEKIKKEAMDVISLKAGFEDAINKLENFKQKTEKEKETNGFNNKNNNMLDPIEEEEEDHKSKSGVRNFISKPDRMEIKQRMISFKLKIFDKVDLKKVMNFWIEKKAELKYKKLQRTIIKKEEVRIMKDKENKTLEKGETNVKYVFKKPDQNLLRIIPFCNNIFSIQKSDN